MSLKINTTYLRTLLALRNMTLGDVSDKTGIHVNTLKRIMDSGEFTDRTLSGLCDALDTTPAQLLSNGNVEIEVV